MSASIEPHKRIASAGEPTNAHAPVQVHFGIWSSDFSRVTGQAIVTARAAELLRRAAAREFVYRGKGAAMFLSWLRAIGLAWWCALRGKLDTLYMVSSRSTAGFMRDLPAYLLRFAGLRVVVHVHGSDIVDLLVRPGVGMVARSLMRRCELVLPSQHLVEPLQKLGLTHLHVCENFVADPPEQSEFGAPDRMATSSPLALTILWNSNIIASKGFFCLAEAVASMHRDGQAVRLIALGTAIADKHLSLAQCERRLDALRHEPWFEYRGTVDRLESMQLLRSADVVCLPSHYTSECQPLALIEAMCAARPLVIANTPALRATVEGYPCQMVDVVSSDSVRTCLQHVERSSAATLDAAAAAARKRFAAARFDRQLALILHMPCAATPPTAQQV